MSNIPNGTIVTVRIIIPKVLLDHHGIPLHTKMAAKAALYIALKDNNLSNAELAKKLNCDEKEINRLLDPKHSSKIPRIETALSKVFNWLLVSVKLRNFMCRISVHILLLRVK